MNISVIKPALLGLLLGAFIILATQAMALPPTTAGKKSCDCTAVACLTFAATMRKPLTLTGTLVVLDAKNANDEPYHPYALKLAQPVCVQGDATLGPDAEEATDAGPTETLQLAGTFNTAQAKSHVGQLQTVRGTLFAPSTGWHVTPVLMDVQALTNPPTR